MENEIAGSNDDDVAHHEHGAQRHVPVFVHDGCNDVGAACAAIVLETECQTDALGNGTQYASHEVGLGPHQLGQDGVAGIVGVRHFEQSLQEP